MLLLSMERGGDIEAILTQLRAILRKTKNATKFVFSEWGFETMEGTSLFQTPLRGADIREFLV